MINATIIGQYFLSKNKELTDIQIQKLVYYAYAWYMVINNGNKIFEEKPEAWIHGPVFRTLFDNMKDYQNFTNNQEAVNAVKKHSDFLDKIFNVYGKYSGNELEKMTHSELPWIRARYGLKPHEFSQNKIEDRDIMKCYGNI